MDVRWYRFISLFINLEVLHRLKSFRREPWDLLWPYFQHGLWPLLGLHKVLQAEVMYPGEREPGVVAHVTVQERFREHRHVNPVHPLPGRPASTALLVPTPRCDSPSLVWHVPSWVGGVKVLYHGWVVEVVWVRYVPLLLVMSGRFGTRRPFGVHIGPIIPGVVVRMWLGKVLGVPET